MMVSLTLKAVVMAKVINLSAESEPDIYKAIRRDALLENVTVDENGKIDFTDGSVTENTRVSYPIYHIDNIVKPVSKAGHANKVIFLSADAFGVLPPVSILTPEQTQYYLSGFTAKLLVLREVSLSLHLPSLLAFGAAFLSLHPTKYAQELVKKMEAHGSKAYLVNTGWNGTGKLHLMLILVVSSMLSSMALSIRLRLLGRSPTLASVYLWHCQTLTQLSSTHVILMLPRGVE